MLTPAQIDIIINTLKPFNPVRIGIFGSYARGENTEGSDIDILYLFENSIGLFNLVGIKNELESKLQTNVDLVSEKYIHSKLKPRIMEDLQVIYEH